VHLGPQRRPLDDFDTGAPGIGDVGDGVAALRIGARRLVEFNAFRLDLLHEGCVVLHVETDVVEHTPSRRRLLRVSLGLIFACGSLAMLSMILTGMNHASIKDIGGPAVIFPTLFFKLAAVPMAVLVLFLIYYFLPNGRPPVNRVIAAAIGVGVLLEVLKYFNKLVWPWFQRKLEIEYRIFQYSVALIFLGFLASMLVLAGAEWAARGHRFKKEEHA